MTLIDLFRNSALPIPVFRVIFRFSASTNNGYGYNLRHKTAMPHPKITNANGQSYKRDLVQLYDEQGRPLKGKGADKHDVFKKGALHGAAHVWIWRKKGEKVEVLLQQRATSMRTWPNAYDASSAGHIDLGEDPLQAALRELKEELNLSVNPARLKLISVYRASLVAPSGDYENEFQWLYLLESSESDNFSANVEEVKSIAWIGLDEFHEGVKSDNSRYVPHGLQYYGTLIHAFRTES